MVGEQAGAAFPHGQGSVLRQFRAAEAGVGRAADVVASGGRDHVVEGRHVPAQAGQRGGIRGVRVDQGVEFGAYAQQVGVQRPFAGGGPVAGEHLSREREFHHVSGRERGRLDPARRDQASPRRAHGGVARAAGVSGRQHTWRA